MRVGVVVKLSISALLAIGSVGVVTTSSATALFESITGVVIDTAGNPLPGVYVSAGGWSTTTGADGAYALEAIGTVQLQFSKPGYRPEVYDEVTYPANGMAPAGTLINADAGNPQTINESLMRLPRLTGQVVDSVGNPVAASVFSENVMFGPASGTTADAGGLFTIDLPEPGGHRLRASSAGFITTYAPSTLSSMLASTWNVGFDQLINIGQITMVQGGSISGTVTSSSGPIVGATVNAWPNPPQNSGAGPATTDVNGNYTITGLAPGTWQVNFTAPGYLGENYDNQPQYGNPSFNLVSVTAGTTTTGINAELAAGATVTGHVTDSLGNALQGAGVQLFLQGTPSFGSAASAMTDVNGDYTIQGLAAGQYLATAGKQGLAQVFATGASVPSVADVSTLTAGTVTTVNFALQPLGSITGHVLQPNGQPLVGASVSASLIQPVGISWFPQSFGSYGASAFTDAAGSYTLTGLAPADFTLMVGPGSQGDPLAFEYYLNQYRQTTADPVAVVPGAATTGIDFRLEVGGVISGRVTGPNGEPIVGTGVSAIDLTSQYAGSDTYTDANGEYVLRGLIPGSFTVQVNAIDDLPFTYYPSTTSPADGTLVTVALGQTRTGIDIQMQAAARIEATVLDPAGNPIPISGGPYSFWGLGFCTDPSVPVATFSQCSAGGLSGPSSSTKPAAGQYIGTGIAGGTYNVAAFAAFPIAISASVPLTLIAGDVATCTFQIHGPASCTVTHATTDPDSDGVPGATENGAPGGDGNGDLVPDSEQSNVTSLPSPVTGGGYVTVAVPAGLTLSSVTVIDPASVVATPPPGATVDNGVIAYTVDGVAVGATVDIDVFLTTPTTATGYAKIQDGQWVPLPGTAFTKVNDRHFILHLTDGGEGDEDGEANGVIVDPGAPITLDTIGPTITCPATPTILLNAIGETLTAAITDARAGVANATATVSLTSTTIGQRTAYITSADLAGNTATVPCPYVVGVRIKQLTADDESHGRHDVDAGDNITLQWRTVDAQGRGVSTPSTISLVTAATTCGADPVVTGPELSAQLSKAGVRYEGNGYWSAKWKTDRAWRGCRQLTVLVIGDSDVAKFRFSKP